MPNQVLLTFAGDEKQLTSSFDRVGGSAKKMGDAVGSTSKDLDKHANGLDKVGGSADNAERNIIGVHDVIDGTATIMQGPGKQGIVAYLQGWADLAGGIAPMAEYLAQTKVATLAQAAAQKVAALGAKVWAGTQWLLNAAMTANPIGLVVAAIVALIAVFVIAWKHSETFRNIVIGTWNRIKAVALGVGRWFRDTLWPWIKGVGERIGSLFQRIPGLIRRAFGGLFSIITWPFRTAFNFIADAWNNTIGRLSWSVPSWVPGIGGMGISVPNLPHFHAGGVVPGVVGTPTVALLQAGEKINSIGSSGDKDAGGWVTVRGDALIDTLTRMIADRVSNRGGRPAQLGIKVA